MLIVAACVIMVTACGGEAKQPNSTTPANLSVLSKEQLVLERKVTEGDFELAIYTKKTEYAENELIDVYAELTYMGELDEIEIGHAMYPVGFDITEHTRAYHIGGSMNEPYIVTLLKRNEPVRYQYSFSGGYSGDDDKDFIAFVENIKEDKLHQGEYTIRAGASFNLHGNDSAPRYQMNTSISFIVGSDGVQQ